MPKLRLLLIAPTDLEQSPSWPCDAEVDANFARTLLRSEERLLTYFCGLCLEVLRDLLKDVQWSGPDDGYDTAEECLQAT